ncbi:MAG: hypothetical protein JSS61_05935 [Verrucomicrobia bacterium]|nr:hypothetical protein [Verrucomicrobiota bacterium]
MSIAIHSKASCVWGLLDFVPLANTCKHITEIFLKRCWKMETGRSVREHLLLAIPLIGNGIALYWALTNRSNFGNRDYLFRVLRSGNGEEKAKAEKWLMENLEGKPLAEGLDLYRQPFCPAGVKRKFVELAIAADLNGEMRIGFHEIWASSDQETRVFILDRYQGAILTGNLHAAQRFKLLPELCRQDAASYSALISWCLKNGADTNSPLYPVVWGVLEMLDLSALNEQDVNLIVPFYIQTVERAGVSEQRTRFIHDQLDRLYDKGPGPHREMISAYNQRAAEAENPDRMARLAEIDQKETNRVDNTWRMRAALAGHIASNMVLGYYYYTSGNWLASWVCFSRIKDPTSEILARIHELNERIHDNG